MNPVQMMALPFLPRYATSGQNVDDWYVSDNILWLSCCAYMSTCVTKLWVDRLQLACDTLWAGPTPLATHPRCAKHGCVWREQLIDMLLWQICCFMPVYVR